MTTMPEGQLISKIELALEQLRPNLQMDGGDIRFVKYKNGTVYVAFLGACIGCPMAEYTLKFAVEQAIKEHVPDVVEVVLVDEVE